RDEGYDRSPRVSEQGHSSESPRDFEVSLLLLRHESGKPTAPNSLKALNSLGRNDSSKTRWQVGQRLNAFQSPGTPWFITSSMMWAASRGTCAQPQSSQGFLTMRFCAFRFLKAIITSSSDSLIELFKEGFEPAAERASRGRPAAFSGEHGHEIEILAVDRK